jgi:acetyltransferase-like isoleucine patch superfamily enzyme
LNVLALIVVAPVALTCALEARGFGSKGFFSFWAHVFAILPGTPGTFLRRAFYRRTLTGCAENVTIQFGVLFSRQNSVLESGVFIGSYALIGSAWIGENTLIGSRASLLSGGSQHEMLPSGRWSATDEGRLQRIKIGPNTWIGEGAILMADVGAGSMVAAGSVVSSAVPSGVMVGGNPARFIRRLWPLKGDTDVRTASSPAVS